MGYRNETEHLRHRVEQLEGEIASLKGARRNGKEELFDGRVKRQTVLLVGLALVASASVGLCALPTGVAVVERANDALSLDQVARDTTHREATFEGTLDLTTVFDVGYYNHAAPLVEDPRIIVSCGWDPYRVEAELTDRFDAGGGSFRGHPSSRRLRVRSGRWAEPRSTRASTACRSTTARVVELRHDGPRSQRSSRWSSWSRWPPSRPLGRGLLASPRELRGSRYRRRSTTERAGKDDTAPRPS
ncbi:MAG: hypothetical protein R3B82_04860 [Sandaracinaceae bacterium]